MFEFRLLKVVAVEFHNLRKFRFEFTSGWNSFPKVEEKLCLF